MRRGREPRWQRGRPGWARLPIVGEIGIHFRPERWVRRKLYARLTPTPAMVTPDRVKRTAELQRFPGNREATPACAPAPRSHSILHHSGASKYATLILWGAQDRWVPVADAFLFQNDIKGARVEIFEKLGHDPMGEDPVATSAVVAAFLKPIAVRSASFPPPCRSTGNRRTAAPVRVPLVARPLIAMTFRKYRRQLKFSDGPRFRD